MRVERLPLERGGGHAEWQSQDCLRVRDWLVIAPTRSQELVGEGRSSEPRKDGLGLYRVGKRARIDPRLARGARSLRRDDRHAAGVKRHDDEQLLAAGLGAAGLVALGIGTWLFATSFDTKTTKNPDGSSEESQDIHGGRLAGGSALIAGGFGFGIAGILVSPSAAERAKADQARYVFVPPDDDFDAVKGLVGKHNQAVRDRCKAAPAAR